MLDTYRNNVTACLILSTSRKKGSFDVASTDKFLYALAPLPYATGLFPLALGANKEDVIKNWAIDKTFEPKIADEEREKRIKGWNKAVKYAYGWAKED